MIGKMSEMTSGQDNNLLGWKQQWQKEIGIDVVVSKRNCDDREFPTTTLERLHFPMLLTYLPGHPEILAFPDNSHHMIQHYPKQSEFEDRGDIDPFKLDADSELDQSQQIQAKNHIDGFPVLLLTGSDEGKKPLHVYKPLQNALKSCNADFSDLWTVRLKLY